MPPSKTKPSQNGKDNSKATPMDSLAGVASSSGKKLTEDAVKARRTKGLPGRNPPPFKFGKSLSARQGFGKPIETPALKEVYKLQETGKDVLAHSTNARSRVRNSRNDSSSALNPLQVARSRQDAANHQKPTSQKVSSIATTRHNGVNIPTLAGSRKARKQPTPIKRGSRNGTTTRAKKAPAPPLDIVDLCDGSDNDSVDGTNKRQQQQQQQSPAPQSPTRASRRKAASPQRPPQDARQTRAMTKAVAEPIMYADESTHASSDDNSRVQPSVDSSLSSKKSDQFYGNFFRPENGDDKSEEGSQQPTRDPKQQPTIPSKVVIPPPKHKETQEDPPKPHGSSGRQKPIPFQNQRDPLAEEKSKRDKNVDRLLNQIDKSEKKIKPGATRLLSRLDEIDHQEEPIKEKMVADESTKQSVLPVLEITSHQIDSTPNEASSIKSDDICSVQSASEVTENGGQVSQELTEVAKPKEQSTPGVTTRSGKAGHGSPSPKTRTKAKKDVADPVSLRKTADSKKIEKPPSIVRTSRLSKDGGDGRPDTRTRKEHVKQKNDDSEPEIVEQIANVIKPSAEDSDTINESSTMIGSNSVEKPKATSELPEKESENITTTNRSKGKQSKKRTQKQQVEQNVSSPSTSKMVVNLDQAMESPAFHKNLPSGKGQRQSPRLIAQNANRAGTLVKPMMLLSVELKKKQKAAQNTENTDIDTKDSAKADNSMSILRSSDKEPIDDDTATQNFATILSNSHLESSPMKMAPSTSQTTAKVLAHPFVTSPPLSNKSSEVYKEPCCTDIVYSDTQDSALATEGTSVLTAASEGLSPVTNLSVHKGDCEVGVPSGDSISDIQSQDTGQSGQSRDRIGSTQQYADQSYDIRGRRKKKKRRHGKEQEKVEDDDSKMCPKPHTEEQIATDATKNATPSDMEYGDEAFPSKIGSDQRDDPSTPQTVKADDDLEAKAFSADSGFDSFGQEQSPEPSPDRSGESGKRKRCDDKDDDPSLKDEPPKDISHYLRDIVATVTDPMKSLHSKAASVFSSSKKQKKKDATHSTPPRHSRLSLSKQNGRGSRGKPISKPGTRRFQSLDRPNRTSVKGPSQNDAYTNGSYVEEEEAERTPKRACTRVRSNRPKGVGSYDDELYNYTGSSEEEASNRRGSIHASSTRRGTAKKKQTAKPETICIDSSDEGETEFDSSEQVMDESWDLVRIALGDKVFDANCSVELDVANVTLTLNFSKKHGGTSRQSNSKYRKDTWAKHSIKVPLLSPPGEDYATLKEFKYYTGADEQGFSDDDGKARNPEVDEMNFIVLRLEPHKSLVDFNITSTSETGSKYDQIILDFGDDEPMEEFRLELVKSHQIGEPMAGTGCRLGRDAIPAYGKPLLVHSEKEKKLRRSSSTKHSQKDFARGKNLEDVLLVYPFDSADHDVENAAKGLTEASAQLPPENDGKSIAAQNLQSNEVASSDTNTATNAASAAAQTKARRQYVTICLEDFNRLDPEEYLNDSLVDFWMQWISRHETKDSSEVHFFTSHLFSTLSSKGTDFVESWTSKKNIDVFTKRMIFLPVNRAFHWSLCVIVNPGSINLNGSANEDDPMPCLIFLDSLKIHKSKMVHNNILKWLNAEWRRLGKKGQTGGKNFTKDNFPIYCPTVPFQNNGWDCGVFVCRYAWAMYQLRHELITYKSAEVPCIDGVPSLSISGSTPRRKGKKQRGPFSKLITDHEAFKFKMSDIDRIRVEIATLIGNLSMSYTYLKKGGSKKNRDKRQIGNVAAADVVLATARTENGNSNAFPTVTLSSLLSEPGAHEQEKTRLASDLQVLDSKPTPYGPIPKETSDHLQNDPMDIEIESDGPEPEPQDIVVMPHVSNIRSRKFLVEKVRDGNAMNHVEILVEDSPPKARISPKRPSMKGRVPRKQETSRHRTTHVNATTSTRTSSSKIKSPQGTSSSNRAGKIQSNGTGSMRSSSQSMEELNRRKQNISRYHNSETWQGARPAINLIDEPESKISIVSTQPSPLEQSIPRKKRPPGIASHRHVFESPQGGNTAAGDNSYTASPISSSNNSPQAQSMSQLTYESSDV